MRLRFIESSMCILFWSVLAFGGNAGSFLEQQDPAIRFPVTVQHNVVVHGIGRKKIKKRRDVGQVEVAHEDDENVLDPMLNA